MFFNYKHTYNYGDQAIENIMATSQLDKLLKSDSDLSFSKFVRSNSKKIHGNRSDKENYGIYFVDPSINGVAGEALLVKALPYIIHLLIHKIFFLDNYSFSYFLLNIFIYIFTFLSLLNFCNSIKINNLKIPLIVGFLSNVYVMQLHRGGLENHVLLFLPIFFFSAGFVIKIFTETKLKYYEYLTYPFIFSLSFLNGYPNTSTILPFFLGILVLCLLFYDLNLIKNIKKIIIIFLLLILSILFYVLESIFWSKLLNQHAFYHLSILPDRTITMFKYLFGSSANNEQFSLLIFIKEKGEILNRFLRNIFNRPFIYHAPHEPGMLLGINYFNLIEKILFLFGLFFIFFKRKNRVFFLVNLSFLISLMTRIFTHDNFQINKASFDYYSLCIYFSYISFYYFYEWRLNDFKFLDNIIKFPINSYYSIIYSISKKRQIIFNQRFLPDIKNLNILIFLSIILIYSFTHNLNRFQKFFIFESGESLRQLSSLEPLRKFMRNNYENNIFLIQQSHGYIANIDRILMLNEKIEYEVLSNFKKIEFDNFDKVYLITFNLNQIGALREFLIGTNIFNEFKIERFSYIKEFKSSTGHSGIYLYEINKNQEVYVSKNRKRTEYEINTQDYSLNKIIAKNFSGVISLKCDKEKLEFTTSNNNHSVFTFDFKKENENGMYYFEDIFEKFDKKYEKNVNKLTLTSEENLKQQQSLIYSNTLFTSKKKLNQKIYYEFKENIKKFYIKFSYIFFNDPKKKNNLSVKYYSKKFKDNILKLKSNGKNFYGIYQNFHGDTDLKQNKSYLKEVNTKSINFEFELYNDKNEDNAFLSSKNKDLNTPDSDSLEVYFENDQLKNFVNYCQEKLYLSFVNKRYTNSEVKLYATKK